MKKKLKAIILLLVIGFVVLQFFQPEKNLGSTSGNDLLTVQQVPEDVASILKNSCYDCHSNNTRYLWYHQISPVSLMIDHHIQEGKKELNFSEWGKNDLYDQITHLDEIKRETGHKSMPLKSYLLMHPKSKLSDEQIKRLDEWTSELGEKLLSDAMK